MRGVIETGGPVRFLLSFLDDTQKLNEQPAVVGLTLSREMDQISLPKRKYSDILWAGRDDNIFWTNE